MAETPIHTWNRNRRIRYDHVMSSMLHVGEFLYQATHVDVGQTAHAVVCQTQSLSGWADSLPLRMLLSNLLFKEGDDVSPTFLICIN